MDNSWQPYGDNIKFQPSSKNKVIGDSSKYYLYGTVLAVGEDVKKIRPGDQIGYTLWGLKDIEMADGTKTFYIKDTPQFILAVIRGNGTA